MRGRGKSNIPVKYNQPNNKISPQHSMAPFQMPTCLRLLVSEMTARAIVGVGGYELERIRNQMDGALNVDGDSGMAATVTFQSVKDHLLWAVGEVAPHLSLAPPPYVPHIPIKSDLVVNVLMPEHICGYFIGKAGAVIKKLSKEFGLFLKVESDMLPESNEKVLIIAGSYQKIDAIIEYIIDFYCQKLDVNSIRYYFTNYAKLLQNGTLLSVQSTSFAQTSQGSHTSFATSSYDATPIGANLAPQSASLNHNFMMTGYMGGSGGASIAPSTSSSAMASAGLIQAQPVNSSSLNSISAPKSEYNPYS